jgi:hypothetical protein
VLLSSDDYEELRQVFARLAYNFDHGHDADYVKDWAEDGVLELHLGAAPATVISGRDKIQELAVNSHANAKGFVRHWNVNHMLVSESETEVNFRSFMMVIRTGSEPAAAITVTAEYDDTLVKQDGRWSMKKRIMRTDPAPTQA